MPLSLEAVDRKQHALIAPGQGSQVIGMGHELALNSTAAMSVWNEADRVLYPSLGFAFTELVWNGTLSELTKTENAQPAIIVRSLAQRAALMEAGIYGDPYYHTGNSLGLITALVTSGAIDAEGAVKLGEARGKAFKYAVDNGPKTTMMAVQHDKPETVTQLVEDLQSKYPLSLCLLNTENQVIVGGRIEDIEAAKAYITSQDARTGSLLRILDVDAAFHSPFMETAVPIYGEAVEKIDIQAPIDRVLIAGSTAKPVTSVKSIKEALVSQLTHTENWRDIVRFLGSEGVLLMTELNESPTLSDMNRRLIGGERAIVTLPNAKDSKGDDIVIGWRWNASVPVVDKITESTTQESQEGELDEMNEEVERLLKLYEPIKDFEQMEQFLALTGAETYGGMMLWYRKWMALRTFKQIEEVKPDSDFVKNLDGDSLDYEVLRADVETVYKSPVDKEEAQDRTSARKMALATWEKKKKLLTAS